MTTYTVSFIKDAYVTVEADSVEEAEKLAMEEVNACGVDCESNWQLDEVIDG
jgi:hypothetical protein